MASVCMNLHSPHVLGWGLRSRDDMNLLIHRSNGQKLRPLANANRVTKNVGEVILVDPLEAKRLAAIQMQKLKAREKFERQRRIEAINGAWAMIGLTVGLVVEGHTGNGILAQLVEYWNTIFKLFGL